MDYKKNKIEIKNICIKGERSFMETRQWLFKKK